MAKAEVAPDRNKNKPLESARALERLHAVVPPARSPWPGGQHCAATLPGPHPQRERRESASCLLTVNGRDGLGTPEGEGFGGWRPFKKVASTPLVDRTLLEIQVPEVSTCASCPGQRTSEAARAASVGGRRVAGSPLTGLGGAAPVAEASGPPGRWAPESAAFTSRLNLQGRAGVTGRGLARLSWSSVPPGGS